MATPGEAERGFGGAGLEETLLDPAASPWSPDLIKGDEFADEFADGDEFQPLGGGGHRTSVEPTTTTTRHRHSQRSSHKQPQPPLESLDYEPVNNDVGRFYDKRRFEGSGSRGRGSGGRKHVYGYTGLTLAKSIITLVVGIVVGVLAFVIDYAVEMLFAFKRHAVLEHIAATYASGNGTSTETNGTEPIGHHHATWGPESSFLNAIGWYQLICVVLVAVASVLCVFWAPQAAGGGVTGVMAFLNGTKVPGLLGFKSLLAKAVGVTCAVGSGLAVGPEGPMVHIGAAVASCLVLAGPMKWLRAGRDRWVGDDDGDDDVHSNASDENNEVGPISDADGILHQKEAGFQNLLLDLGSHTTQREFISAGAAAGLAAAFGAPMGGVLFSLEEASTYWSKKVMWRSFLCASSASISLSMCRVTGGSGMLFLNSQVRNQTPRDYLHQLPFFVLTAAVGGCLGVVFNLGTCFLSKYVRPRHDREVVRVLECVLVVLLTAAVRFYAAESFGSCVATPLTWKHFGVRWRCAGAEVNDVATLLFSAPNKAIGWMLSMGETETDGDVSAYGFTARGLWVTSGVYLVLMLTAYGLAVPGGVFLPSVFLGATYGGALGLLIRNVLPNTWDVQPGVYALIGATATLAGVFRSSISLVVIMVEGTGGISFAFVVIVAVVVSNTVCALVSRKFSVLKHGVYHSDLDRNDRVIFLPNEPARGLFVKTARDLMCAGPVVAVAERETFDNVQNVLQATTHNGFPVVDHDRQLVGTVSRSTLQVLVSDFSEARNDGRRRSRVSGAEVGSSFRLKRSLDARARAAHLREPSAGTEQTQVQSSPSSVSSSRVAEPRDVSTHDDRRHRFGETTHAIDDPDPHSNLIDVASFMHRAPLSVHADYPAQRAHLLFTTLGLRHLCVIDKTNKVRGVITRKDVANFFKPE